MQAGSQRRGCSALEPALCGSCLSLVISDCCGNQGSLRQKAERSWPRASSETQIAAIEFLHAPAVSIRVPIFLGRPLLRARMGLNCLCSMNSLPNYGVMQMYRESGADAAQVEATVQEWILTHPGAEPEAAACGDQAHREYGLAGERDW